jgi:16S rRNA (cytosine967-C5)-methyltransferase
VQVLERVAEDGAYASRALDAELTRAKLDPRDAGLATEIVYGSLRVLPELDRSIAAQLTHAGAPLDRFARASLRAACYQLMHLDRLPSHAIVDESVSLVRAKRGPKLAGFVNAVLRKLAANRPAEARPAQALVLPDWVRQELEDSLGSERLARFLAPQRLPPPLGLRAEAQGRGALLEALRLALPDSELEPSLSPLGVVARRVGSPRGLPGYAEGAFSVQEEGAQLVALGLGAEPGERIADVCAGHGGKTTLLARQVGAKGLISAIDRDERKLRAIAPELRRLQLPEALVEWHAIDLSVGLGGLDASFDRVLIDAPCTGLGTVQRRPELLLRLTPQDPARLGALQGALLARAAGLVRVGGVLGFAVCSPTRAEGADVVRAFSELHPQFEVTAAPVSAQLPVPDADGIVRIGPWLTSESSLSCPDAYQLALWRRTK